MVSIAAAGLTDGAYDAVLAVTAQALADAIGFLVTGARCHNTFNIARPSPGPGRVADENHEPVLTCVFHGSPSSKGLRGRSTGDSVWKQGQQCPTKWFEEYSPIPNIRQGKKNVI
jgi:hypothetical protein